MTRKSVLTLGIVMTLSHTASAVYLNPQGRGEVLIYPYYTVKNSNSTLLSITNPTGDGKAIKVRFLEGHDGRDTLDFNLYLAPSDMWVGQIVQQGEGAAIFTNDNSCTVPQVPTSQAKAQPFKTTLFGENSPWGNDGGPTDASRTLEGSIEVIEMGVITNATHNTLQAITPTNGMPANCTQVVGAWEDYWKTDPTIDVSPTRGGLFGSGIILDVGLGTVQSYNAEALAQFNEFNSTPLHTSPTDEQPTLASGSSMNSTTFVNDDEVLTTTFPTSIDAVSSLFMVDHVQNEFWTSASIGASSEWVISFPTKRFYTDPHYVGYSNGARAPFESVFANDKSCDSATVAIFGRDAQSFSIPSAQPYRPCFSVNVLTFSQSQSASLILGSSLTQNVPTAPIANGWADVTFIGAQQGSNGNSFYGLPAVGFMLGQMVNGNDNGVLANFTSLSRHKFHSFCSAADHVAECK